MPPTIQNSSRHDARPRTSAEKKSDLVCRVKYSNALPDVPFDAKFITYPFDSNRYVQYNQTSLERTYKFDLLTEHDLGVPIDLIDPDTYQVPHNVFLDAEDELLLEDEAAVATDAKRSRHHNKNVSWLRKTEYISTEYNRFTQSAHMAEARLGYNIKKQLKEETLYKDRDSQLNAINQTFELVKKPVLQHYSKPGVTAVDILPVFPDFEMWKHPCAQVIFDSDPAQKGKIAATQMEEMSQAMIRGMVDESGDQFVAYFLPTDETLEKRRRDVSHDVDYDETEDYDYVLAREYNWNVKNKSSRGYEENYFFIVKDDGVFYNELETRVRLSKRRKVGASAAVAKSRLIVRHRPLTDQEIAAQDGRVMMLEPAGEDDEVDYLQHDGNNDDDDNHADNESPRDASPDRDDHHSDGDDGDNNRDDDDSANEAHETQSAAEDNDNDDSQPQMSRKRRHSDDADDASDDNRSKHSRTDDDDDNSRHSAAGSEIFGSDDD